MVMQKYLSKVVEKRFLTDNKKYLWIKFELVDPLQMEFFAGQYVSIKVSESGIRRSYSIASTPDVSHAIEIMIALKESGIGSEFLKGIKIGDEVEMLAPMGQFVVKNREVKNRKRLFVAMGSGIVPVRSMIKDLLINQKEEGQIRLHWGMRREEDLFWIDELERLTEEYDNFVLDVVLSKPSDEWSLCRGHVQDCLRRDFKVNQLKDWEGYICGNTKMTVEVESELQELGVLKENIYKERYG